VSEVDASGILDQDIEPCRAAAYIEHCLVLTEPPVERGDLPAVEIDHRVVARPSNVECSL
jgi:hypothetical protein